MPYATDEELPDGGAHLPEHALAIYRAGVRMPPPTVKGHAWSRRSCCAPSERAG